MKTKIKKLAVLGGVAFLASAFAGLAFQDAELVNQNGQPVVKVVVGSNAMASDGVAAANIAAKIANNAFGKKTLTASVVGLDGVACTSSGDSGSGTCTVTDESVTLEITVPGVTGQTHNFQILVGDYIDRELENRQNVLTIDKYELATSETSMNAHPFADGNGGAVGSALVSDEPLYKIDGGKFSGFADATVTDPKTSESYTESQAFYIVGQGQFDEAEDEVSATLQGLVYQAKFDDSDNVGIPVCDPKDTSSSKDYTICDQTDRVDSHRMKIWFLGSEWVIVDMQPPSGNLIDGTTVKAVSGGSVTLAKESSYGIINIGETLDGGEVKVRLDDITAGDSPANQRAVISILDANGEETGIQDTIVPGTTKRITVNGNEYRIRVYQTAPGYTFGAKWAEMALIENEFELKDGQDLDSPNDDWTASVVWKNKDATADDGDPNNGAEEQPDSLRAVLLQRTNFGDSLLKGDSVDVIEDPMAYSLQFNGLDLTSDDYDRLDYKIKTTPTTISLASVSGGGTVSLSESLKITSSEDAAFEYSLGNAFSGASETGDTAGPSDTIYLDLSTGDVYVKESSSSNKYVIIGNTNTGSLGIGYFVAGDYYGSSSNDGGVLYLDERGGPNAFRVWVEEDAGTVENDQHVADWLVADLNASSGSWTFQDGSPADDKINYISAEYTYTVAYGAPSGPTVVGNTNIFAEKDEGYITERGSVFVSETSTSMQFKIAKKLGHLQFAFVPNTEGSADSQTVTLHEGESTTIGGTTVLVKSIDETVGPCSAGSSASCSLEGTDGVSAIISPDNAVSVDAAVPYTVGSDLVVLDSDAPGTGTVITVGGPAVNSVTASALEGSDVALAQEGDTVVKKVGNYIVVAGYSAEDTMQAAKDFLNQLQSN